MEKASKFILPLVCALLISPLFIVLHELGHYLAGRSLGWTANVRYQETQLTRTEQATPRDEILVTSSGPMVSAFLAAIGFIWLRASRLSRLDSIPTPADWLATTMLVMNVARWLRCFIGLPSNDENWLSRATGLPGWLLPFCLGAVAIVALIATVRLHPRGSRLVPFLCLAAGGVVGSGLWLTVLGPVLLP